MKIKRASTGSSWLIVQDTGDGREIIHGQENDLPSAITYLQGMGESVTRQESDALEREDRRVRFRQRFKRHPSDTELEEWIRAN